MSAFKPGEIVDIAIKGVRVTDSKHSEEDGPEITVLLDCEIGSGPIQMPAAWPMVTVERVAPAEWPPRPGDLWRDQDGTVWFAADVRDIDETDVPKIVMVYPHEDHRLPPGKLNQQSGPLALVHREGGEER